MKKLNFLVLLIVIVSFAFFSSCDSDDSGSDGSEAKSLGNSLVFTGNVTQTFNTSTATISGYTNPTGLDYRLLDETDNTVYATDTNGNDDVDVNFNYTGTTHLTHLYSPSGGGITSSNSSAQITTAVIDVETTSDDINNGEFSSSGAKWYYYMYSSAETTLDGTYIDGDENHVYEEVTVFEGWNELVCETSDGETFKYYGGTISSPKWTYMDN